MGDETKVCPQCAETVQKAALMCRFCKHRFDAPAGFPTAPAKKGIPGIVILLILFGASVPVIAIIAAIAIPGLLASQRAANERNAALALKSIASAEFEFRGGDLDGNGIQDFWTRDVQGLSTLNIQGRTLGLIESSIAHADASAASPLPPVPRRGYLFIAMQRDIENKPYDQGQGRNPLRFAFCAYPTQASAGRKTFIVSEEGQVWFALLAGQPVLRWPPNPSGAGFIRVE